MENTILGPFIVGRGGVCAGLLGIYGFSIAVFPFFQKKLVDENIGRLQKDIVEMVECSRM